MGRVTEPYCLFVSCKLAGLFPFHLHMEWVVSSLTEVHWPKSLVSLLNQIGPLGGRRSFTQTFLCAQSAVMASC